MSSSQLQPQRPGHRQLLLAVEHYLSWPNIEYANGSTPSRFRNIVEPLLVLHPLVSFRVGFHKCDTDGDDCVFVELSDLVSTASDLMIEGIITVTPREYGDDSFDLDRSTWPDAHPPVSVCLTGEGRLGSVSRPTTRCFSTKVRVYATSPTPLPHTTSCTLLSAVETTSSSQLQPHSGKHLLFGMEHYFTWPDIESCENSNSSRLRNIIEPLRVQHPLVSFSVRFHEFKQADDEWYIGVELSDLASPAPGLLVEGTISATRRPNAQHFDNPDPSSWPAPDPPVTTFLSGEGRLGSVHYWTTRCFVTKVQVFSTTPAPMPCPLVPLGADLKSVWNTGALSDVEVCTADGGSFPVHKVVLAARSPVFLRYVM